MADSEQIERTFRVYRYECDLYGHLNNAHYLRYIDAVDEQLPPPCGPTTRIRIEFLRALETGDRVRVVGTSARPSDGCEYRQYTFSSDRHEAARAEVEFLAPGSRDGGTPMAPAPPQPAGVLRYHRPIEWRDVDVAGRVGAAGLAALAEDAGIRVCAAHDWPMTRCTEEGLAIILRRHEIELGNDVGLDDQLEISTWASNMRRSMATRHYLLRRESDGGIAARFRSLYVWVSTKTGRPIRIPEPFLASFAPNFAARHKQGEPE